MMNKKLCFLVTCLLVSGAVFAAQERVIKFQNHVRVGYDDNVNLVADGDVNHEESTYITDQVNVSGTFNFSSRTDALLYWQPEFRYRLDADPKFISYQDVYGRLNHAVSQRVFLELSDRFRYQERDGQSTPGGGTSPDQNYIENELQGAMDLTVDSQSSVKVGGGYEIRRWDDNTLSASNDYDQVSVNGTYIRELVPDTTTGYIGAFYSDLSYEGTRGGVDSITVFGGAEHVFSPNLSGNARVGYTSSSVESDVPGGDSDTTAPYALAGLQYKPTERTSLNGSLEYSISNTENAFFNAQDRVKLALGLRHDITAKISLASSLAYIRSQFDSSYANTAYAAALGVGDASENFVTWNVRGTYQINRNNFVELGYSFSDRQSDSAVLTEYDRNRIDLGWRLRL
jgi:hypothetical protein